jgi:hypothetical protein
MPKMSEDFTLQFGLKYAPLVAPISWNVFSLHRCHNSGGKSQAIVRRNYNFSGLSRERLSF